MRALHIADLHIYLSGPRAEECRRILGWVPDNARREVKPDVIIVAGDIFERRSTPQERIFLAEFLRELSGVAPVVLISGNHDDKDDLRLFRKEYGWTMPIEVVLNPGVVSCGGMTLAFLPWPELGLLAKANGAKSIEARRELARSALVDILRGFQVHPLIGSDKPSLLVAHLSVTGASMDTGQPVSGGEDISLSVDDLLTSGAAGIALGHIHLRQEMRCLDGHQVHYAGAPFRGSFGEAKGTKGGLIWEWDGKAWRVTPWDVPARRMVLIEKTWTPPAEADSEGLVFTPLAGADEVRDAEVRVRVTFPAEFREAMRAALAPALDELRATAHSMTVEERPMVVSRTRCAEISAARTTAEKLLAWARAVETDVPAGAESKLGILEKEVGS